MSPRPPCCCRRGARISRTLPLPPRGCGTPGWRRPGAPGSSRTRRACSSRSPGSAGTSATTAPSSPSPASCGGPDTGCSCRPTRFSTSPGRVPRLGCKEALITLGDKPEDRWPEAREWLEAEGYDDTIAYVRAMAIRILEETGLLPHLNPGVMSLDRLPAAQARRAVHGHDAGDHGDPAVERARRAAPRVAGQGAGRPAAGAGGRGAHAASPSPAGCSSGSARRTRSVPTRCSRCGASPVRTTASRN